MSLFNLAYHISDDGDGSYSVHFHESLAQAEKAEDDMDNGFGECCAESVQLKIEDGKIFFRDYRKISGSGKHGYVWLPVQEEK